MNRRSERKKALVPLSSSVTNNTRKPPGFTEKCRPSRWSSLIYIIVSEITKRAEQERTSALYGPMSGSNHSASARTQKSKTNPGKNS